jgi:hypothetical protein
MVTAKGKKMYVLMNVKTKALFQSYHLKTRFAYKKVAEKAAERNSIPKIGIEYVAIDLGEYDRLYGNLTHKVVNLLSGVEVEESINTPDCCSVGSEAYWSM